MDHLRVAEDRGDVMADNTPMVLYAASYESASAALTALDDIEQLHKDKMIGKYDAAVIDKENGKPRIVKRMDRPGIRVIPERFGGGTLPRKDLRQAAEGRTATQPAPVAGWRTPVAKGPRASMWSPR